MGLCMNAQVFFGVVFVIVGVVIHGRHLMQVTRAWPTWSGNLALLCGASLLAWAAFIASQTSGLMLFLLGFLFVAYALLCMFAILKELYDRQPDRKFHD